ncbi:MAG: DUF309 domain-containing protein [Halodesulfovibrio sp.]
MLTDEGIRLWNQGAWFACHEAFEALWLAEPAPHRDVYKALVQVAAAMHHAERGNNAGAARLFNRACHLLHTRSASADAATGMDLVPVLHWLQSVLPELEHAAATTPPPPCRLQRL